MSDHPSGRDSAAEGPRVPLANLRPAVTRTSDGRKIDSWTIDIPGCKACEFDLRMHVTRERTWFEATTTDPSLQHVSGTTSSDINDLRSRLDRAIQDYAEQLLGETWQPNFLIEAGVARSERRIDSSWGPVQSLEIKLGVTPLRAAAIEVGRNSGSRKVLRGTSIIEIIERGRLDEFPKGEGISEQARYANERTTPVGRSLIPDSGASREAIAALQAALAAFGEVLADRLSPERVREGIPGPDDLAGMMEEAISRTRTDTPAEQSPEPF